jgi:PAS domain S-box-containing protein
MVDTATLDPRSTQELELRRQTSATLLDLVMTLSGSVEYEDLLHDVLTKVADSAAADHAIVVVMSSDDQLYYMVGSSLDPFSVKVPVTSDIHPELAQLAEDVAPLIAHRGEQGLELALEERNLHAIWALPLLWRGEVYGLLELCYTEEVELSDPVRDLVVGLAGLIGAGLRGSELYASLHEQTRKRTATELETQRQLELIQRYRDFFQRSFDGIVVLDLQLQVLYINPAGEQITGYARHGLVGARLLDIVEDRDRQMLEGVLQEMGQQGVARGFDLGLITTSGDPILVSISPSAIMEDDEVLVLSFRDVTEARALENELRSTKEFLERLIDSAVDGIVATDVNGQVILFNKGAENIFNMQSGDVVGKLYMEDLYPSGVAAKVMEQLRSTEEGGIGRLQAVRKEILNDNQERVPVSLSANLIYEDGREVGTVAIIGDLRERLRIELRLAQAQEKLVFTEKQALIAELAGTTAHELNQPLTSVMGYAELLKRRVSGDAPTMRAVDTILREAERMAEIVRKIGKITRYETKTYVGGTQILDLEKSTEE